VSIWIMSFRLPVLLHILSLAVRDERGPLVPIEVVPGSTLRGPLRTYLVENRGGLGCCVTPGKGDTRKLLPLGDSKTTFGPSRVAVAHLRPCKLPTVKNGQIISGNKRGGNKADPHISRRLLPPQRPTWRHGNDQTLP
jgi:hypothetical protein